MKFPVWIKSNSKALITNTSTRLTNYISKSDLLRQSLRINLLELTNKTNLVLLAFNASVLSVNHMENIVKYLDALENNVAILSPELLCA